jgi:hypothetical protein
MVHVANLIQIAHVVEGLQALIPTVIQQRNLTVKDSHSLYRRRKDGRKELVRNHELDNRWVVPYNPYLL